MNDDLPRTKVLATVILVASLSVTPVTAQTSRDAEPEMDAAMDMSGDMDMSAIPRVPPVLGYAAGEDIHFIHTEVSDPEIAGVLSEMMGSPVPVVASLAEIPNDLLAHVYVFENGAQPDSPRGPLGFQPDVFDRPAGSDGYTPLRRIVLVRWHEDAEVRVLKSAEDVRQTEDEGDIAFTDSGITVNMPFLTWPGGER